MRQLLRDVVSFDRFANASGFIFDCDGCLLDSMVAWRRVELGLINASGVEFTQEMLEAMRAASMDEVARVFHEKYGVMDSEDAIHADINETMLDYYEHEATLKPGVEAFVRALDERGVPCCIVSASPKDYLEAGMRTCGLLDAFRAIVSTKETGISKQDPRIYEHALELMDAQTSTAWGADDSLYALRVMNECGIATIGTYDNDVAGSFDALANTATIAIHSFEELLA